MKGVPSPLVGAFCRRCCVAFAVLAFGLICGLQSRPALAQSAPPADPLLLDANFTWESQGRALFASMNYRHLIDSEIRRKLRRGLPTKILLTALVRTVDSDTAVSTTYQSCTITWHVWEEMYRVEITRPNAAATIRHWTPTLNGVLRRCAEARSLLIADSGQLATGRAIYLDATMRINPISEELLSKLKRWVTRPSRTTTAAPGSALFSTFTGLFMQRIGDAERAIKFKTKPQVPQQQPPQPSQTQG